MLDDFLIRAALAAVGTAVAAGVLGCFVVWRRMAYFGDATAHAALLGVALSLWFSVSVTIGVVAVACLMALLIHTLSEKGPAIDTLLGVLSHGGLAAGLIAVSVLPGQRVSLESYLFGDVLTVSASEVLVIWAGAVVICAIIWWRWSALITATLSPDLAFASGINPRGVQLLLTLLLALVVAIALKVVGALLITALLIIPAAAARALTRGPEAMAAFSVVIGAISALAGLQLALWWDTPVGPSIVVFAVIVFACATICRTLFSKGG